MLLYKWRVPVLTNPQIYPETVLLVIDDHAMLLLTQAALPGERRKLLAWDVDSALWNLRNLNVDSAIIREGIANSDLIEMECVARGARIHFMQGAVEEGIVRFTLPELDEEPMEALADCAASA
jgi:hypothetical protein